MNRPTRRQATFALSFVCLVAAALLLWSGDDPESQQAHGRETETVDSASFTISGDVRGLLSPGGHAPLNLSFDNPNEHDLTIDRISVTVTEVDAPLADADHPCGTADYAVRQLESDVTLGLAAGDSENLSDMGVPRDRWPVVAMLDRRVNQDGCKEALLTLTYDAYGLEVTR